MHDKRFYRAVRDLLLGLGMPPEDRLAPSDNYTIVVDHGIRVDLFSAPDDDFLYFAVECGKLSAAHSAGQLMALLRLNASLPIESTVKLACWPMPEANPEQNDNAEAGRHANRGSRALEHNARGDRTGAEPGSEPAIAVVSAGEPLDGADLMQMRQTFDAVIRLADTVMQTLASRPEHAAV